MFATRNSARGNYSYLIEVDRTSRGTDEDRYVATVAQVIWRTAGDRVANHPQFHRHYADTLELAIEKARAEAERLLDRFTQPPEVARLVVDSEMAAAPAGVRAAKPDLRKLLYATGGHLIDVQLQPGTTGGKTVMIGQITSPDHPDWRLEGSGVMLERDSHAIARTTTNQFGEFDIEFDGPASDLSLTFALERGGVVVKLGAVTRMTT